MATAPQKAKKTKKQRKYGRNARYCEHYARTKTREKNKIKRLKKHLYYFPQDDVARKAMAYCEAMVYGH